MEYKEVAKEIQNLCAEEAQSFSRMGAQLATIIAQCSVAELLSHLDYAGVIPESFRHDSTEEKLFAKYCDSLLARSLSELGFKAEVIEARGDAADVIAAGGGYTLVGDAKAFRLSRTAKNQKDFKIESLNQWRGSADYACLVAPLYQYPSTQSQIYSQAIRYNVTLLSYTHLAFLIRNYKPESRALIPLWKVGKTLSEAQGASTYWDAVNKLIAGLTGTSLAMWDSAVKKARVYLSEEANQQVGYWLSEKEKIRHLDRDSAVKQLIKALKIDEKISTIRRIIS